VGQFDTAPTDKGQTALNLKLNVFRECGAGFKNSACRGVDLALHNQGLGLFAGVGQATIKDETVGPDFSWTCCQKVSFSACLSWLIILVVQAG
jgi:hypothetical protein